VPTLDQNVDGRTAGFIHHIKSKEFVRSVLLVVIVFQDFLCCVAKSNDPKRFATCVKCVMNEPDRNSRLT
jgi:hypothetical protein